MSQLPPLAYQWDGEALVPLHPRLADRHMTVGEKYLLVEHHDRSQASHNHYFAALTECWRNLPDELALQYPTVEHLRKKLLIRAGYADESSIVCASKAEALRLAAFVRPADDYAIVIVSECVVTRYTAKSQSLRAMGKLPFQTSKDAVLTAAAALIGVTSEQLQREGAGGASSPARVAA